ncbi:MAG: aromatic ring-hydroxylating dioxygenase subunit alpha [Pseudomonadota bacterium]
MNVHPRLFDSLWAEHEPGHALPRGFYTSPEIFDGDIARVWNRNWIWVGHESQIAKPGDYFLFEYGPESLIICRDRDGNVRAHLNVCRHRGSRVCTEPEGNARVFSCPYHAWTYELSGKLRSGREMGSDFDPGQWGLISAACSVFQGMILVCADADAAPNIDDGLTKLAPLTAPFGFEDLKVAKSATYPVPANWKLALENYLECYHCAPAHQDYSRSHTLKAPAHVEAQLPAMKARAAEVGLPTETLEEGDENTAPGASVYYRRYPLYEGYQTGSRSGAPLAPLLGTLKGFDGGATDVGLGVLNNLLIYSDHAVGYRFVPRDVQQTDIEVVWMVRGDAVEGVDYNPDDLTWLWHVTSLDDERIIRYNQAGVNSHLFRPGPLAEMEWAISDFYDFYRIMWGLGPR